MGLMLITSEVIPLLLDACPSFAPMWAESVHDNAADDWPTGRLNYQDASDFVRHITDLVLAGATTELPAIFAVIERLVVEGDVAVRNLAVIGYIEDLQGGIVQCAGLDPEVDIRPWLGPRSVAAWEQVKSHVGRAVMGADVERAPRGGPELARSKAPGSTTSAPSLFDPSSGRAPCAPPRRSDRWTRTRTGYSSLP